MNFLTVKAVPVVAWSSTHPLNFQPRGVTLFFLCFGLSLFGLGEALLVSAGAGVSPWTVLAQGLGQQIDLSIGWSTFLVSACVLILWIPLKQLPGIGTLANAMIISLVIEQALPYLPAPDHYPMKILECSIGILLVGMGSGIYLTAHLGAGPRDGLMAGLARLTDYPIAWVRTALEISAVSVGWLLGGSVGLGTLFFALGIGPAVSLGLFSVRHLFRETE
jgi:uncharacterized membrane protein YczE